MRFFLHYCLWVIVSLSLFLGGTSLVFAQSASSTEILLPKEVYQAIVWVQCDQRQGSGTVVNGNEGYVLTNAHVVLNVENQTHPDTCTVGFTEDPAKAPTIFYRASILRYAFNEARNQDFAILQITDPLTPRTLPKPFPAFKTNEFATVGEPVTVIGFSGGQDEMRVRQGQIQDFQGGFIETNARIQPGDSGGAALDAHFHLIGIPTRIVTLTTEETHQQVVSFELVDIRAVMTWMDTYGVNDHDRFFGHADFDRYHKSAVFITQTSLGCTDVARTRLSSTVFCALPGRERMTFPNDSTFFSWFPDFSNVVTVTPSALTPFHLVRNVTYRPGTLVKSATSLQVYVVVDSFGTMRWIPTELKARTLWGPSWASLVHDIPDEFWTNYTIGQPLDT